MPPRWVIREHRPYLNTRAYELWLEQLMATHLPALIPRKSGLFTWFRPISDGLWWIEVLDTQAVLLGDNKVAIWGFTRFGGLLQKRAQRIGSRRGQPSKLSRSF